jgi:hypothetical protein
MNDRGTGESLLVKDKTAENIIIQMRKKSQQNWSPSYYHMKI